MHFCIIWMIPWPENWVWCGVFSQITTIVSFEVNANIQPWMFCVCNYFAAGVFHGNLYDSSIFLPRRQCLQWIKPGHVIGKFVCLLITSFILIAFLEFNLLHHTTAVDDWSKMKRSFVNEVIISRWAAITEFTGIWCTGYNKWICCTIFSSRVLNKHCT